VLVSFLLGALRDFGVAGCRKVTLSAPSHQSIAEAIGSTRVTGFTRCSGDPAGRAWSQVDAMKITVSIRLALAKTIQ